MSASDRYNGSPSRSRRNAPGPTTPSNDKTRGGERAEGQRTPSSSFGTLKPRTNSRTFHGSAKRERSNMAVIPLDLEEELRFPSRPHTKSPSHSNSSSSPVRRRRGSSRSGSPVKSRRERREGSDRQSTPIKMRRREELLSDASDESRSSRSPPSVSGLGRERRGSRSGRQSRNQSPYRGRGERGETYSMRSMSGSTEEKERKRVSISEDRDLRRVSFDESGRGSESLEREGIYRKMEIDIEKAKTNSSESGIAESQVQAKEERLVITYHFTVSIEEVQNLKKGTGPCYVEVSVTDEPGKVYTTPTCAPTRNPVWPMAEKMPFFNPSGDIIFKLFEERKRNKAPRSLGFFSAPISSLRKGEKVEKTELLKQVTKDGRPIPSKETSYVLRYAYELTESVVLPVNTYLPFVQSTTPLSLNLFTLLNHYTENASSMRGNYALDKSRVCGGSGGNNGGLKSPEHSSDPSNSLRGARPAHNHGTEGNPQLSRNLVVLFQHQQTLLPSLLKMIELEIWGCDDPATLFRRDNMGILAFRSFLSFGGLFAFIYFLLSLLTALLGQRYLTSVLQEQLARIAREQLSCELEARLLTSQDHLATNVENILGEARAVQDAIFRSTLDCPPSFLLLFRHINILTSQKFPDTPDAGLSAIKGFLFLRLFVPALLEPVPYGLWAENEGLPPRTKVTLRILARSLQKVANGSRFSEDREPHLHLLNDFVLTSGKPLNQFVLQLLNRADQLHMRLMSKVSGSTTVADPLYFTDSPFSKTIVPVHAKKITEEAIAAVNHLVASSAKARGSRHDDNPFLFTTSVSSLSLNSSNPSLNEPPDSPKTPELKTTVTSIPASEAGAPPSLAKAAAYVVDYFTFHPNFFTIFSDVKGISEMKQGFDGVTDVLHDVSLHLLRHHSNIPCILSTSTLAQLEDEISSSRGKVNEGHTPRSASGKLSAKGDLFASPHDVQRSTSAHGMDFSGASQSPPSDPPIHNTINNREPSSSHSSDAPTSTSSSHSQRDAETASASIPHTRCFSLLDDLSSSDHGIVSHSAPTRNPLD